MLGHSVVPHRNRIVAPPKSNLMFRLINVLVDVLKQAVALSSEHAHDVLCKGAVNVDVLCAGDRVSANDGMNPCAVTSDSLVHSPYISIRA